MTRIQFLGISTAVVIGVGVAISSVALFSSLKPTARAKAEHGNLVQLFDLPEGQEKVVSLRGRPYLIIRRKQDDFVVFDLVPRYKAEIYGSEIHRYNHPNLNPKEECSFREQARGTCYDESGDVVWGPPSAGALPMRKLTWEYSLTHITVNIDET